MHVDTHDAPPRLVPRQAREQIASTSRRRVSFASAAVIPCAAIDRYGRQFRTQTVRDPFFQHGHVTDRRARKLSGRGGWHLSVTNTNEDARLVGLAGRNETHWRRGVGDRSHELWGIEYVVEWRSARSLSRRTASV